MTDAYRWLVAQGLWHDLTFAVIGGAVAWVFALHPVRRLLAEVRDLRDKLDPETPGGITVLLEDRQGEQPK